MTIVLDHTIVPARDKQVSAEFFARIFGLALEGLSGFNTPSQSSALWTLPGRRELRSRSPNWLNRKKGW